MMPVAKFENYMQAKPADAKRYQEIQKGAELAEFNTLKVLVESRSYQKNEKDAIQLKKLASNRHVKNYLLAQTEEEKQKWEGRKEVMEYTSLKSNVVDYSKETARYNELKNHADILFHQAQNKEEMDLLAKLDLVTADELDGNALKRGWNVGYLYPTKEMKAVHSYPNELQAYTSGKNIETIDGVLNLTVRKEEETASVWDAQKGMISKSMAYTADMLHSDKIAIQPGMFIQVKAEAKGKAISAINLQNPQHTQLISIMHQLGKQMQCGVKHNMQNIERIIGLPYAVYGLYWGKAELIWYINDMEVCRMPNTLKDEKMYLHLYQQVTAAHQGTATMKVDWVKVYNVK